MGKDIFYEIKNVDINELEYYPENPRINYIIKQHPREKITQSLIEQELLKLDSTKERIKDIEDNKGMIDEIYVLGNQVVEGNTRLCVYRKLSKKHKDDSRWKTIKARILHDVSPEELCYILSVFHIKGKTPWDAYEKAAFIHKMINDFKKSPKEIAQQLNKHENTIEASLNAYNTMSTKYLGKTQGVNKGSRDELKKYSYFEALYLQKDLAKRAKETPMFVDEFIEWVKEDRFRKATDVRDLLPKILDNKKACRIFRENDPDDAFDDAIHVLHEHKPEKVDRFYKKINEFHDLIRESEVLKIKDEIEENTNKKNILRRCFQDFKRFCKDLGLVSE